MNTYHYDMEVSLYVNEEIVAESQEQADAILEALLDNDDYLDHDMHDLVVDRNDADIESHQIKVTNCNVWPGFEEEGARERAVRYLGEEVYGRE